MFECKNRQTLTNLFGETTFCQVLLFPRGRKTLPDNLFWSRLKRKKEGVNSGAIFLFLRLRWNSSQSRKCGKKEKHVFHLFKKFSAKQRRPSKSKQVRKQVKKNFNPRIRRRPTPSIPGTSDAWWGERMTEKETKWKRERLRKRKSEREAS